MSKHLEFIFGLSSLIGLIITLVIYVVSSVYGDNPQSIYTSIVLLAVLNITFSAICMTLLKRSYEYLGENAKLQPTVIQHEQKIEILSASLKSLTSDYSEVSDILHSIQDQMRDRSFELTQANFQIEAGQIPSSNELTDLERTNEMFLLFLVDNIKNMMDILTGDKCSVCIKILAVDDSPKEEIMVRTLMRDSSSYRERKSSDHSLYEYPYYENSAFKTILSKSPDNYYVSDCLNDEKTYINANGNWRKYYNATLVCPIRIKLIEEEQSQLDDYSVLGFICVDNVTGRLSQRTCVQLLASISDSLFNHLLLFSRLKEVVDFDFDPQVESDAQVA